MADIKKGMVVQLKSGGPRMTADSVDSDRGVFCKWFNDNKEVKGDYFDPEALSIVKSE